MALSIDIEEADWTGPSLLEKSRQEAARIKSIEEQTIQEQTIQEHKIQERQIQRQPSELPKPLFENHPARPICTVGTDVFRPFKTSFSKGLSAITGGLQTLEDAIQKQMDESQKIHMSRNRSRHTPDPRRKLKAAPEVPILNLDMDVELEDESGNEIETYLTDASSYMNFDYASYSNSKVTLQPDPTQSQTMSFVESERSRSQHSRSPPRMDSGSVEDESQENHAPATKENLVLASEGGLSPREKTRGEFPRKQGPLMSKGDNVLGKSHRNTLPLDAEDRPRSTKIAPEKLGYDSKKKIVEEQTPDGRAVVTRGRSKTKKNKRDDAVHHDENSPKGIRSKSKSKTKGNAKHSSPRDAAPISRGRSKSRKRSPENADVDLTRNRTPSTRSKKKIGATKNAARDEGNASAVRGRSRSKKKTPDDARQDVDTPRSTRSRSRKSKPGDDSARDSVPQPRNRSRSKNKKAPEIQPDNKGNSKTRKREDQNPIDKNDENKDSCSVSSISSISSRLRPWRLGSFGKKLPKKSVTSNETPPPPQSKKTWSRLTAKSQEASTKSKRIVLKEKQGQQSQKSTEGNRSTTSSGRSKDRRIPAKANEKPAAFSAGTLKEPKSSEQATPSNCQEEGIPLFVESSTAPTSPQNKNDQSNILHAPSHMLMRSRSMSEKKHLPHPDEPSHSKDELGVEMVPYVSNNGKGGLIIFDAGDVLPEKQVVHKDTNKGAASEGRDETKRQTPTPKATKAENITLRHETKTNSATLAQLRKKPSISASKNCKQKNKHEVPHPRSKSATKHKKPAKAPLTETKKHSNSRMSIFKSTKPVEAKGSNVKSPTSHPDLKKTKGPEKKAQPKNKSGGHNNEHTHPNISSKTIDEAIDAITRFKVSAAKLGVSEKALLECVNLDIPSKPKQKAKGVKPTI